MLSYDAYGSGSEPVLLLHGFLGSSKNLATLAKRIVARAPSTRVIVPDLTGHGTSPRLPKDADLRTLAVEVLNLMRELDLPKPVRFVGHSLGGRVALQAKLIDDSAVGHVTLLDITPSSIKSQHGDKTMDCLLAAPEEARTRAEMKTFLETGGIAPEMVDWLLMNLVREGEIYRWRVDRKALAELRERVMSEDLWKAVEARIPGEPCRVRCIRGARSQYVPDQDAERLTKSGCAVVILDSGHLIHVERLDELVDLLCSDN